jgi:ribosome biogenesis protein UTP30
MANLTNTETRLTTKPVSGTPYQLDRAQVIKATTALHKHVASHAAKKAETSAKKDLLADADTVEDGKLTAVWLSVTTKKPVKDTTRLKPHKVVLPHSIAGENSRVCLITVDPQRAYKDLKDHPAFPADVASKISRIIGITKLKAKYKSFETRRQLAAEYDIFLCDNRIISALPSALGKPFYKSATKRPIPVDLTAGTRVDKAAGSKSKSTDAEKVHTVGKPETVGREIASALGATTVNLTSSTNTSIKVGYTSMTAEQISDNVEAVVLKLTESLIPKGWRGIRALHIKTAKSLALPVWLADELWVDEGDVLEEKWQPKAKDGAPRINEKKRRWEEWEDELLDDETKAERRGRKPRTPRTLEDGEVAAISSRNAKKKLKQDALKSVQQPLIAN